MKTTKKERLYRYYYGTKNGDLYLTTNIDNVSGGNDYYIVRAKSIIDAWKEVNKQYNPNKAIINEIIGEDAIDDFGRYI